MTKPWKSIPHKSKFYEIIVSYLTGKEYFRTTLTGDAEEASGIFWALKRQYPEKAHFHVRLYEINTVRQLILGPEIDGSVTPEGGVIDTELDHAVDILRQVLNGHPEGPNQTALEALDLLETDARNRWTFNG